MLNEKIVCFKYKKQININKEKIFKKSKNPKV